jgi:hypothetical protein
VQGDIAQTTTLGIVEVAITAQTKTTETENDNNNPPISTFIRFFFFELTTYYLSEHFSHEP